MYEISALRHAGMNPPELSKQTSIKGKDVRITVWNYGRLRQATGLSGRDIHAIRGMAGSTQPIPATT